MSDKLQFVAGFPQRLFAQAHDKLKFVGHWSPIIPLHDPTIFSAHRSAFMLIRPHRSRLIEVKLTALGSSEVQAEVALRFSERSACGSSRGPAGELSVMRLVANATLRAVERLSEERLRCRLAELNRVRAFDRELVMVLVEVELNDERAQLLGKCYVNTRLEEATARAALDATNRYFEYASSTPD